MANQVQETYGAVALTASAVILGAAGGNLGGFLCTTAGNIKLNASIDGTGAILVDTCAVVAGQFLPVPLSTAGPVYATLSGGCKGTMFFN